VVGSGTAFPEEPVKKWLEGLQTTALVIATGCLLAFLTGGFFFFATVRQKPIDNGNFTAWLMFVAAMLGVGYATFAKKRDTTDPDIIRATADAQEKIIRATAAASPPLTPEQAVEAARSTDTDEIPMVPPPAVIAPVSTATAGPDKLVKDD
jgi:hypothetical protein